MSAFGRSGIIEYAKREFGTKPDHTFEKYPNYVALRHDDGGKWFGLLMNVPRDRLGLAGDEELDVLDVKCLPENVERLLSKRGYLPAYHMNKKNWITVLLDGSVPKADVLRLLRESQELVE